MENKMIRSRLMLITSMVAFGTIGILRRALPQSSALIAFYRGLLGGLFLWGFGAVKDHRAQKAGEASLKPRKRKESPRRLLLLILTGAMIGVNWILLFEGYNHTTVPVATLCYYMEPTLVMLLSVPVLGEKMTAKRLACCLVAAAGMVLVSGVLGGEVSGDASGIFYGLGAALFYSGVVLSNKALSGMDPLQKTRTQLLSAALVLIPYLLLIERPGSLAVTPAQVGILLVMGIFHTGICYALYFGSMEELDAQTVALYSYIDPVTALILSAVLLGESLTGTGFLGAVLILGAALALERK